MENRTLDRLALTRNLYQHCHFGVNELDTFGDHVLTDLKIKDLRWRFENAILLIDSFLASNK